MGDGWECKLIKMEGKVYSEELRVEKWGEQKSAQKMTSNKHA